MSCGCTFETVCILMFIALLNVLSVTAFYPKIFSVIDIVSLIRLMMFKYTLNSFNDISGHPSKQGVQNRMFYFNRQSVCVNIGKSL